MFILTVRGKETEGAYSVIDEEGENILYLFQEEDDAVRYAMMLEEEGSPEMHVIEIEDEEFRKKYFVPFDKIPQDLLDKIKYKISFEKISRMHKNALENGFTSYAEA